MAPSHSTTMIRNVSLFLVLFLVSAVAFVGCDTTDDEQTGEDIVGTWNASSASVILAGFGVPVFEAGDSGELSITFDADGAFTFVAEGPIEIDPPIGETVPVLADGEGATIGGDYTFSADTDVITFTPTEVDDQPFPNAATVSLPVEFEDDDTVVLTVENTEEGRAVLSLLLGEQVPQEILENIDGGEVTFRR